MQDITKRPTPETDAKEFKAYDGEYKQVVRSSFSRTLEQQRNEARDQRDELKVKLALATAALEGNTEGKSLYQTAMKQAKELNAMKEQRDTLREALERIAKWDGEHPDEAGEWMSSAARTILSQLPSP